MIAESYLLHMEKNKPLYLIAVQDGGRMTDLFGSLLKHMEELLCYLTDYFRTMQDKNLMKKGDADSQAFAFLSSLYGYFSSGALAGGRFQKVAKDTYIKQITMPPSAACMYDIILQTEGWIVNHLALQHPSA
nr:hypothetical protein [Bacillus licheniformis]